MPPLNTGVDNMAMPEPVPSEMEVDYDKNITTLYESITSCEWDKAIATAKESPKEAQTWVVRHYERAEGAEEPPEIMWRFLPIHSACARQPPASVVSALLKSYPDGAKCVDDQGMYPLHYACGNQASREVIRLLLVAYPQAAKMADPRGMLPIHYLACWGPSSVSIIDMILVANRDVSDAKDADGNTALDLAMEGEYVERDAVIIALRRWLEKGSSRSATPQQRTPSAYTQRSPAAASPLQIVTTPHQEEKSEKEQDKSPRTVSRLRHEITKLKNEFRNMEESKEREMDDILSSLRSKVEGLENELESTRAQVDEEKKRSESLEEEVAMAKKESEELVSQLQDKEELLMSVEDRLAEATQNLVSAEEERDEMSTLLAHTTEEHGIYKKKHENINDRLGSLTASLATMAETQSKLNAEVQDRDSRLQSAAEVRRAKLQGLMDFEMQLFLSQDGGEPSYMADFEQQQKEMDAIAAVINAMRQ